MTVYLFHMKNLWTKQFPIFFIVTMFFHLFLNILVWSLNMGNLKFLIFLGYMNCSILYPWISVLWEALFFIPKIHGIILGSFSIGN